MLMRYRKTLNCILLSFVLVFAVACIAGAEKITLRYGTFVEAPKRADVERGIAEFEKAHPNVEVIVEQTTWDQYWTKLYADVAVGEAPDVFKIESTCWVFLVESDVLMNLRPYMARLDTPGTNLDEYFPAVIEHLTIDDKLLATPAGLNSLAFIYYKPAFDEAGIAYPPTSPEDWTWSEFKQTAAKLTAERRFGAEVGIWPNWWGSIYYSNGGELTNEDHTKATGYLDSAENIETIEFWTSVVDEGFAPKPGALDHLGGSTGAMLAGAIALAPTDGFHQMAEARAAGIADQFGGVKAPYPDGKELVPTISCHAFCVPKATKHPMLAAELAAYLSWATSTEMNKPQKLAPTMKGAMAQVTSDFAYLKPIMDMISQSNVRPQVGCSNRHADILIEEIQRLYERVTLEGFSVEKAIGIAAENYDRRVAAQQ